MAPSLLQNIGMVTLLVAFLGVMVFTILTKRHWGGRRAPSLRLWQFTMSDGSELDPASKRNHRWLRICMLAALLGGALVLFA